MESPLELPLIWAARWGPRERVGAKTNPLVLPTPTPRQLEDTTEGWGEEPGAPGWGWGAF